MANGFFHCKVIEGDAVALQFDLIDPVTPIAKADFVTGSINNPVLIPQPVNLFKFTGTQSNGSDDGTMIGVDNESTTLKAQLLMDTDAVQAGSFTATEDFPIVNTTDATPTPLGSGWELPEGKRVLIDITFDAQRTDSFDLYTRSLRYVIFRLQGGPATAFDDEDQYYKHGPNNITGELILSGNVIQAQVTGQVAQDWKWSIIGLTFELETLV